MNAEVLRAEGIDYDGALARFVGKREIYEKYLRKFLDDNHANAAITAYENKDFHEMLEQTHALKGVAGTLGLTALYDVSAEIVKNLRNDEFDGLDKKLADLLAEWKRIRAVIAAE